MKKKKKTHQNSEQQNRHNMDVQFKQPSSEVSRSHRQLVYFGDSGVCEMFIQLCTSIFISLDLDVSQCVFNSAVFICYSCCPKRLLSIKATELFARFFLLTMLEHAPKSNFPWLLK